MTFKRWIQSLKRKTQGGSRAEKRGRRSWRAQRVAPLLERLEDRSLPSVSILNNGGSGYAALHYSQTQGYVPPDTCGAAGPTNYVETVNQTVAIYSPKDTGASSVTDTFSHFWFTVGGLPHADGGSGLSDPIVVYDDLIGRFIVGDQDVNFSTHVSRFDIAVSKTNTPTSLTTADWNFYSIVTTESGYDADYPGNFGYNHDAFVFTLNMFPVSGSNYHTLVVSVSASDLASGAASPSVFKNDVSDFSLRPTVMHDSVAGGPMWFVTEHGDNSTIDVIKMTNVLSNSATFAYTNLNVTDYVSAAFPKNPNGTVITDDMDGRIYKAAEWGGKLVASHTVGVNSTQDAAQWYEIDVSGGTPTLLDQGRVTAGNNTYVFYPTVEINASGQIGMTYMKSGTDTGTDYMSMYVTGRTSSDAAGTMETSVLVPAGAGVANYSDFSSGGRAGDLSGINVDPVTGTFWAVNEFATNPAQDSSNWGTAVANFSLGRTVTWSGAGSDSNWSTGANWVGGIAPASGDTLVFPNFVSQFSANDDFAAGTTFQSIVFTGGGYALTGNAFALAGGIDASASTGGNEIDNNLTLTGAQNIVAGAGGSGLTVYGTVANGGFLLTVSGGSGSVILWGAISGAGGLTKTSTGTLDLAGANTYGGATTVSAGTLVADTSGVIPDASNVTVNGTLDLTGRSETFASLAGSGSVLLDFGTLTLGGNFASTFTATFSGAISGTSANVVDTATNLLEYFTGANTYAGTTTVNIPNGIFGGSGTTGGLVVTSGQADPGGANTTAIWNIGNLNANSGNASLHWELLGSTAGTGYDQFNVTGTVTLGTGSFGFGYSAGFTPAPGTNIILIKNDGADAVVGTLGGAPEGTVLTLNNRLFQLTYHGGDGNDVALIALDNPPTANGGGPYTVAEGNGVSFNASGSSDPDGEALTYSWDINGDGVYGDATGVNPTLTWAQLQALSPAVNDGPATFNVRVRVDDGHGNVVTSSATTLTVTNVAPTASISAPNDGFNGIRGNTRTFTLTATDPSNADQAAGFTFNINWGDGSGTQQVTGASGTLVSHIFQNAGTYTISVTATDKDGGVSTAFTRSLTISIAEIEGNNLLVGGTTGNDTFNYTPGTGTISVTVNGTNAGTFSTPTGQVIMFGYAGTDTATVNGTSGSDTFVVSDTSAAVAANGLIYGGNSIEGYSLVGGSGTDTLVGDVGTNVWTMTGSGAGNLNGVTFSQMEILTGGGGAGDTLVGTNASTTWTLTGNRAGTAFGVSFSAMTALQGGTGTDTLVGPNVTDTWTVTGTGTGSVQGLNFTSFEALTGGSGTDTLIGPNATTTWTISSSNAGNLGTPSFSGMENLVGGSGNDTFKFTNGAAVTGTISGGTGTNTLDYSSAPAGVTVNLLAGTAAGTAGVSNIQNVVGSASNDSLTGDSGANILTGNGGTDTLVGNDGNDTFVLSTSQGSGTTIAGGNGTDTVQGANAANTWTVSGAGSGNVNGIAFSGVESLIGNANSDTFKFTGTGSLAGTIDGGTGTNALDYSGYSTGVTVNLLAGAATGTAGVANIQNLTGTPLNDNLAGDGGANAIQGDGGSDTLTGNDGNDTFTILTTQSATSTIDGGVGTDVIIAANQTNAWTLTSGTGGNLNGLAFSNTENLTGGTGTDTLTGPNLANVWTLTAATAGNVNGTLFSSMESLVGGTAADTLISPNTTNTWTVTTTNAGTLGTLSFSGMESLTGGTGNDTFKFSNGKNVTGSVDGGAGTNALDYSLYTTGVTVNLTTGAATAVGGAVANVQNVIGTAAADSLTGDANANVFTANGGSDTLVGNDGNDTFVLATTQAATTTIDGGNGTDLITAAAVANTWTITAAGAGNLNGMAFSNIESLKGANNTDTFKFSNGAAVAGTIDGGTGTNALDYSLYTTGVTVNIATGAATGTGGIANIQNVAGGAGNDSITGDGNANVISGGGGSDTIQAGDGDDSITLAANQAATSTVDGGPGTDTLTSLANPSNWVLTGPNSGTVNGISFANVESVAGNGGSLVGPNTANTWTITATNAGTLNAINFSGMASLVGGSSTDLFKFLNGVGVTGSVDGGAGANTLDYSQYTTGVSVNLTTGAATAVGTTLANVQNVIGTAAADSLTGDANANVFTANGGSDTLVGNDGNDTFVLATSQAATTTIDGGNGTDTVQGANQTNTWTVTGAGSGNLNGVAFANVENLTGNAGADTFKFSGSGSIAGALDGGAGTDVVDYSLYATGVTVNLLAGTATGVGTMVTNVENVTGSPGNDSLTGNASNNAIAGGGGNDAIAGGDGNDTITLASTQGASTTVDGGNGTDILVGPDSGATFTVSGANAGNVNGMAFSNVESLTGGAGNDSFAFANAGTLAGVLNGGAGTNTLDYSAYTVTGITANLTTGVATLITGAVSNIQNVNGTSLNDTLTGSSANNVLASDGGVDTIIGNDGNDTIVVGLTSASGSTYTGGNGTDTLVGANSVNTWLLTGANQGTLNSGQTFSTIEVIVGGSQGDTIVGPATTNIWNITGTDAGNLNSTLSFSGVEGLAGGSANDLFKFSNGAAVSGQIDGGAGINTLDYSLYTTGVTVDLLNHTATGVGTGLANIQNATGSPANDTIAGDLAANVITAGGGSDTLAGNDGNDTFVLAATQASTTTIDGGAGSDTVQGANVTNAWALTGANSGTVNGIAFTNVEGLAGGTGTDTLSGPASGATWVLTAANAGTVNGVSFSSMESLAAGAGADTLTGPNTANTWNVTAANAGNLNNVLNFTGMESLTGGTANDAFKFSNGVGVSGSVDGGAGTNTLDYSLYTTGVTVNLSTGTSTAVGGAVANVQNVTATTKADSLTGDANANVFIANGGSDTLVGNDGNDTFVLATSQAATTTIDGGNGTDTVIGPSSDSTWAISGSGSGNVNGIAFANVENLTGGGGNDTFAFSGSGSILGTLDGGAGTNTLDYTTYATGVTVNLATGAATGTAGIVNIQNVTGSPGNDSLTGDGNANVITAGGGVDTLVGGAGNDTIVLGATQAAGTTVDGGTGTDLLQGANVTAVWTLTGTGVGNVNGMAFSNVESFAGGTGTDTLVAADAANTWTVTGANAGTLGTLTFSGMENLTGGALADSFKINTGASVSGVLDGGAGTDTLTGADVADTWHITGTNQGNAVGVTFQNVENLTGGSNNDTFQFGSGTAVTGTVNGGAGTNALDYSLYASGVTVNLLTGTATGTAGISNIQNVTGSPANDSLTGNASNNAIVGGGGSDTIAGGDGNDTITLSAGQAATTTVDGGNGTDTLIGPDSGATFTVSAPNAGNVNGASFTNVESLTGGAGNDTFAFAAGGSLAGTLNGGAGTNTLDYSSYGAGVTVNLGTGVVTAVTGAVTNVQNVTGTPFNDSLTGSTAANVIAGDGGSDTLAGSDGNDTFMLAAGQAATTTIDGGNNTDTVQGANQTNAWALTGANAGTVNGITFSNVESLAGGTGTDTLTGPNTANTWSITAANAGTLGTLSFSGIENLTGGSANDTFKLSNGVGVSGSIDGGAGINTLDYSLYTSGVTVNLLAGTGTGVGASVANVQNVVGTAANDGLTGNSADNVFTANGGSDTLAGNDGNDTFVLATTQAATTTIDGGNGTDTIQAANQANSWILSGAGSGSINGIAFSSVEGLAGGTGTDTLSGPASGAAWVLSGTNAGSVNGVSFSSVESLVGGAGTDTLTGPNAANTWTVTGTNAGTLGTLSFSGMENLTGGTGTDSFKLNSGSAVTGLIDGGAGGDTLTGQDTGGTWNVTGLNQGNVNGTAFANIENLTGGSGNDTFKFSDGAGVAGAINGGGGTNALDYSLYTTGVTVNLLTGTATGTAGVSNVINVTGGIGNDTLTGNASNNAIAGSGGNDAIAGGDGNDTITLASTQGASTTVDGGNGTDILVGPDSGALFAVTGAGSGSVNGMAFANIESLTGGAGNDSFAFASGGSLAGTVNGGAGTNTLDYSSFGAGVSVNLTNGLVTGVTSAVTNIQNATGTPFNDSLTGSSAANVFNANGGADTLVGNDGNDTFVLASSQAAATTINGGNGTDTVVAANIANTWILTGAAAGTLNGIAFNTVESLAGGSATDSLTGPNTANGWVVTGVNAGTLGALSFTGMENLIGGTGNDTFAFSGSGAVSGTVNGGAGTNALDYSLYATGVTVNLLAGTATGTAGISNIQNVTGSPFNDTLTGDANANAIVAGGGNDAIAGGDGNDTITLASTQGASTTVDGGNGTDILVGPDSGALFAVTGAGSGSVNGMAFANIESLTGGAGNDSFAFASGGSLAGTVNGGAGTNTLDYSSCGSGVTVNLGTGAATGVTGVVSNVQNVTGTPFNDSLTGDINANVFTANGGSDTLAGSDGNDVFVLSASQATTTTIDGGNNTDSVQAANGTNAWTLTGAAAGNVNGIVFTNVESLAGGTGTDTLTGPNTANTWTITSSGAGTLGTLTFSGMESLAGGSNNDTFKFSNGAGVSGTVNGGAGTNALDYSLYATGVTVNLLAGTATGTAGISNIQNVTGSPANDSLTGDANANTLTAGGGTDTLVGNDGNDTFVLAASQAGATIDGGNGTDSLQGPNATSSWAVTGANAGTVNGASFTNVENLTGGSGNDTFAFSPSGTLSGALNGGTGSNTLDYSSFGSGVTVNLGTGVVTGVTGAVSNVQNVTGTPFNDSLTGSTAANVIAGFGGSDTLAGSDGNDTFVLAAGQAATTTIDGGNDTDTVQGPNTTNAWLLTGTTAGNVNGIVFTNVESLAGGTGTDTLTGSNTTNTWSITAANAGTLGTLSFSGIENLVGGTAADTFQFANGAGVSGSVDGGSGTNTLDYSQYATGVTVNLLTGTATGVGTTLANIRNLVGSAGNDTLTGNTGNNTITANGGADTLVGNDGNDTFVLSSTQAATTTIDGGNGTDTIQAATGANTWTISGAGSGNLNGITFANVENLTGAGGADTFKFSGSGSIAGAIDGANGTDALDYSLYATGVTVNLLAGTATGVGTTVANVENVTGSPGNDTLTGNASNNAIAGSGGNDAIAGGDGNDTITLASTQGASTTVDGGTGTDILVGPDSGALFAVTGAGSGSVNGMAFANVESLTGGAGNDSFAFASGGSLAGTVNGGAGTNTLDYSSFGAGVTANLSTGVVAGVTSTVSNIQNLTGTPFNDSLTGSNAANVIAGNGGSDTLAGSAGNDVFLLIAGQAATTTIDGGTGTDTVQGANTTNAWALTGANAGTVNGITFSNVESLAGGTGTDTLTGPNTANTWSVTAANAGTLGTLSFSGTENLTGGSANDTFKFSNGVGVSGSVDGGAGANTLDYSLYTTGVNVNLLTGTVVGVGGTVANIQNVAGTAGNDSLTGDANANVLTGNGGSDTLVGNDGNDTFVLATTQAATTTIDGGIGTDTVQGAAVTNAWVLTGAGSGSVNGVTFANVESLAGSTGTDTLTGPNATNVWTVTAANAGNVSGTLFSSMEAIVGGTGTDTLVGPATANTWSITATNAGTLGTLSFSAIENLTGGTANDTFKFSNGKNVTGSVDGGAGTNALDYSLYTTGVTVNLTTGSAAAVGGTVANVQNITGTAAADVLTGDANGNVFTANGGSDTLVGNGGNDTFVLATSQAATTTVDGGTGTDSVKGPNATNLWLITGSGAGNVNGVTFANVENLTGGTGNDTFRFSDGTAVAGTVDGGTGANALDYSLYTTGVAVNLGTGVATGTGSVTNIQSVTGTAANDSLTGDGNVNVITAGGGADTIDGGAGDDTIILANTQTAGTSVNGNTGTDTVVGPNAAVAYVISGAGAGTINGWTFAGVENLTGGAGNDTFAFASGGSLAGTIDGGAGVNTLDYSSFNVGVSVKLNLGTATATAGVANVQNVFGSAFNDILTGGSANAIIVGNGGNDTITGGSGRNILIGGGGSDTVVGGGADDIIIGGTTSYDANLTALMSLMAEWGSADSYATRINFLKNGGGANGSVVLNTSVVFDDGVADTLTGKAGLDWFFQFAADTITDLNTGGTETVN